MASHNPGLLKNLFQAVELLIDARVLRAALRVRLSPNLILLKCPGWISVSGVGPMSNSSSVAMYCS
jgi:hypothetical protein